MKWKPLHLAAVLYVLTALTSYVICSTYAKYAASETVSDSARAAKWGVTVFAEGNLFGENYSGPSANTITHNADGSITVKSLHSLTLGNGITTKNAVAPGTKNETGLVFGLTGKPETAVHLDVTIRNQEVALRTGVYYFLYEVEEGHSKDNIDLLLAQYGTLYQENQETDDRGKTITCYNTITEKTYTPDKRLYYVNEYEKIDLVFPTSAEGTTFKNWPYCPVVYSLHPVSGTGLIVDEAQNTASVRYPTSFTDKSLDIISMTLKWVAFNDGMTWPDMDSQDVFTRTISKDIPANTDLSKIWREAYGIANERLTWEWVIDHPGEDLDRYNLADSVLGRLAAEKLHPANLAAGDSAEGIVVMEDRHLKQVSGGHWVYAGPKNNGCLILPVEYEDYCLETMFELEITVSQID